MQKGQHFGGMDETHDTKESRAVLQGEKPLAHITKTGKSLGPSGFQLQSRYVEQWINDVLRDAEDLKMPGVVARPENLVPISRYEVDRIGLNNKGMSFETVDRVYRALFVHSVGFFQMIQNATAGMHESEIAVITQTNIWRVF